jgi:hypothetical protein
MAIEDLKELKMKKIVIAFVVSALLSLLTASAQDAEKAGKVIPTPLPRDLEIQLALSTMPRHLRDKATVYVLNPAKGFEVAQKGTNGFHAFVARTGDDTFMGTWPLKEYRDDILYPVSFDAVSWPQRTRRNQQRVCRHAVAPLQIQCRFLYPALKETKQTGWRRRLSIKIAVLTASVEA